VQNTVANWVERLNIQNAALHFEARCKPRKYYDMSTVLDVSGQIDINKFLMPIEVNLRIGGSEVWSMNNAAFGVNLFTESVKISLGIKLDAEQLKFKQNNPRYNCIAYDYHPARSVQIKSIDIDFPKLIKDEDAVEFCLFRCVGEMLTFQDYMGWLTVKHNNKATADELKFKLDQIMEYVKINFTELE
jgi:hypothetical protein